MKQVQIKTVTTITIAHWIITIICTNNLQRSRNSLWRSSPNFIDLRTYNVSSGGSTDSHCRNWCRY